MNEAQSIDQIISELRKHKSSLLNLITPELHSKIEKLSVVQCLTIVVHKKDGSIKPDNVYGSDKIANGYIPRFIAFLRKKKYKGHEVDSYLTDIVVSTIVSKCSIFYSKNVNTFIKPLTEYLISNKIFIKALSEQVVETSNSTLSAVIRKPY